MPKHHEKKPHEQGVGAALVGNADELINILIKDKDEKEWALNEIVNGGPEHKQVYSALLLKRMYALVQLLEKSSGTKFTAQKGVEIIAAKDGTIIPVQLPLTVAKKEQLDGVAEAVPYSPGHELAAFNLLLQAIEWGIKAVVKNNNNN